MSGNRAEMIIKWVAHAFFIVHLYSIFIQKYVHIEESAFHIKEHFVLLYLALIIRFGKQWKFLVLVIYDHF